jgi:hypothetical protein
MQMCALSKEQRDGKTGMVEKGGQSLKQAVDLKFDFADR